MSWIITGAVDEFLTEAGQFLHADPVRNTVVLSVTEAMRAGPAPDRDAQGPAPDRDAQGPAPDRDAQGPAPERDVQGPLFGWWRPAPGGSSPVAGAFMLTGPDFPAFLTSMSAGAAAELAGELAAAGRPLRAVNAVREAAEAFAAEWRQRTGDAAAVREHMRLHRLEGLVPPDPWPDGSARVAGMGDRDLMVEWFGEFAREIGDPPGQDHAAAVGDRLGYGGITVWEADGAPVSMAGVTRVLGGMARVAPVYTPPALRGRGYGGAVTAAVSQAALDAGAAEVVLYTDLANPVSNFVYQRLGYRPVEDRVVLDFERARVTLPQ